MTSPAKLLVAVTGCLLSLGWASSAADLRALCTASLRGTNRQGRPGSLRLTLTPAPGRTIAFSDRPGRQGRTLATRKFVSSWTTYGFGQDPPNAALSIDASPEGRDVFLLTLKRPRLRNGNPTTQRHRSRASPAKVSARFAKRDDRLRKLKFGEASLFIDPTNEATPISLSLFNSGATESLVTWPSIPTATWSGRRRARMVEVPGSKSPVLPGQSPPFVQFSLNSKQMTIVAPPGGTAANFTINLYLTGSSPFFEGSAIVGRAGPFKPPPPGAVPLAGRAASSRRRSR